MLTALEPGTAEWTEIARRGRWQMTRMNLNTFARHGVFGQPGMTELIADRLREPKAIAEARVFPYQILSPITTLGVFLKQ
jgi:60 kDa SS-A/Ro ribonucleoprotein